MRSGLASDRATVLAGRAAARRETNPLVVVPWQEMDLRQYDRILLCNGRSPGTSVCAVLAARLREGPARLRRRQVFQRPGRGTRLRRLRRPRHNLPVPKYRLDPPVGDISTLAAATAWISGSSITKRACTTCRSTIRWFGYGVPGTEPTEQRGCAAAFRPLMKTGFVWPYVALMPNYHPGRGVDDRQRYPDARRSAAFGCRRRPGLRYDGGVAAADGRSSRRHTYAFGASDSCERIPVGGAHNAQVTARVAANPIWQRESRVRFSSIGCAANCFINSPRWVAAIISWRSAARPTASG